MNTQLFEIMRFNILTATETPCFSKEFSFPYLFAWHARVYPIGLDGETEKSFDYAFKSREVPVSHVLRFLKEYWDSEARTGIEFDDLMFLLKSLGFNMDATQLCDILQYLRMTQVKDPNSGVELATFEGLIPPGEPKLRPV